ncbi:MAG: tRNA preQ1(34) S-adenosylmethionine ribosyltransferase-isomerase QueA [Candidatus Aadella gelida]|nr:tRNA preQ1(34) S-adenosylmethionine ribosyltransferase-isomerase QueA [Candidatus Aadella gelida]
MKLKEFVYDLPKELIAQEPLKKRDTSRLMVMDRAAKTAKMGAFRDILAHIKKGDCVVFNDTRVVPVRFYGKRKTGGKVEIFLLNPWEKSLEALVRPSKRVKEGEVVELENGINVTVGGRTDIGRSVEFNVPLADALKTGHVPLPPYISREDNDEDKETYQTVYARKPGATASPTAGLHFTEELISEIKNKGAEIAYVTLHTSYGTFAPVSTEEIEDHPMHEEYYELTDSAARSINTAKRSGGKVLAVGTTSVRVLETAAAENGTVEAGSGMTCIFIYPGYRFKIIDGMVTNFHLPGSTLLMLVSAFADREFVVRTYEQAIKEKFRFFSYGDAMLIV